MTGNKGTPFPDNFSPAAYDSRYLYNHLLYSKLILTKPSKINSQTLLDYEYKPYVILIIWFTAKINFSNCRLWYYRISTLNIVQLRNNDQATDIPRYLPATFELDPEIHI